LRKRSGKCREKKPGPGKTTFREPHRGGDRHKINPDKGRKAFRRKFKKLYVQREERAQAPKNA